MPAHRALACLLAAAVVLGACADERDPRSARARLEEAIAEGDAVGARDAALDLRRELPETPEAVIEVARVLGEIGEMNRARWMLEEARIRHPESIGLALGLAETSLRVGDAEGALAALEDIPETVDEAAYAEVLRARAHIQLGHLEEGLDLFDRAHERFDEPVLFRLERVDVLMTENRPEEALETVLEMQADPAVPDAVRKWLAIRESDLVGQIDGPEASLPLLDALWAEDPSSAEVATRRASLLVSLDRATDALDDLRGAIATHPQAAPLYVIAAQTAVATGDLASAESLMRQRLDVDASANALSNLALFLNRLGRAEEAVALLEQRREIVRTPDRIELDYLAIALAIEADDLHAARIGIDEFGRKHPRNPRLGYLLARLDLAEGRPEAAVKRLAEVLTRLDRADVKHLLGVALERSGDIAGAELRFGHAAQENPQQIASWSGLLRTLEAQGRWERAAEVAIRMIQIAPASPDAYQTYANAKVSLSRAGEAEALLRDLVGRNPDRPGPRAALSFALRRQGRAAEALAILDAAPGELANDRDLIAERAIVLGELGRASEGLSLLDGVGGDETATRALRLGRIYLLFADGHGDAALLEAERAAAIDPVDATPHRMTADYHASRGHFEASIDPYRRALDRASDAGVAFRLGIALERSGRDAEAIDAYRRAIEIDENAIGPRNNLALVLARVGEDRKALEMAQSAYARAESDPVVMDTLATLYLDFERAPRAVALLEKARDVDPGSVEIAYHLALAYRQTQRRDEARTLLLDLDARLEPDHVLNEPVDAALASVR